MLDVLHRSIIRCGLPRRKPFRPLLPSERPHRHFMRPSVEWGTPMLRTHHRFAGLPLRRRHTSSITYNFCPDESPKYTYTYKGMKELCTRRAASTPARPLTGRRTIRNAAVCDRHRHQPAAKKRQAAHAAPRGPAVTLKATSANHQGAATAAGICTSMPLRLRSPPHAQRRGGCRPPRGRVTRRARHEARIPPLRSDGNVAMTCNTRTPRAQHANRLNGKTTV